MTKNIFHMKKGVAMALAAVLCSALMMSCRESVAPSRPLPPYVSSLLADTLSEGFRPLSDFNPKDHNRDIAVVGSLERVSFIAEAMMEADMFNNIDGKKGGDGLTDFAGEVISPMFDLAFAPYSEVVKDSGALKMSDVAVRNLIMALDTLVYPNNYDWEHRLAKRRAKVVILASPEMSAYAMNDIDTLLSVAGKDVPVISVVDAMLDEAFEKNPMARNFCVFTPDSTVLPLYEACLKRQAAARSLEGVTVTAACCPSDTSANFLLSFLDIRRAAGTSVSPADVLLLDDFSLDPRDVSATLEAILNPYSEETLANNKLISGRFSIVSASDAVSRKCYSILRGRNLFTHNIAWPKSECYVTSKVGDASLKYSLLPFSFHYLKPEESVFIMANSPKTMEAYVQD